MALSETRSARLVRIEAMVSAEPGITNERIAQELGVSPATIHNDLGILGLRLWDRGDVYLHDGLWCVRCDCGEYVPICAEEGEDACPQCGRVYAVRVVRR